VLALKVAKITIIYVRETKLSEGNNCKCSPSHIFLFCNLPGIIVAHKGFINQFETFDSLHVMQRSNPTAVVHAVQPVEEIAAILARLQNEFTLIVPSDKPIAAKAVEDGNDMKVRVLHRVSPTLQLTGGVRKVDMNSSSNDNWAPLDNDDDINNSSSSGGNQVNRGVDQGARLPVAHQQQQERVHPALVISSSGSTLEGDSSAFRNAVNMGKSMQNQKNYDRALDCYREALLMKNKKIAAEPEDVQSMFSDVLFNIGTIHQLPQFQDAVKSLESFHYCLDVRRECLGSHHPSTAEVMFKLASLHTSFREYEYALQLLVEVLSILLTAEKEDKKGLIQVWTSLGQVQQALGHTEDAKSSFFEASQVKQRFDEGKP
jgi:hypothetical protein